MDTYINLKNFITYWELSKDDVFDLLKTLKKESLLSMWSLRKKLNGCYELYFGFDGPIVTTSESEREDLIKKIDQEYITSEDK